MFNITSSFHYIDLNFGYAASSSRSPDSCEDILPGGNAALLILFIVAMVLAFWH